ncbi:hypothetical protein Q9189_008059 [Teloschistes chrysophthalmus]
MDFAPYQDTAPERTRALSPPRDHPPPSHPTTHHSTSPSRTTNTLPAPSHFTDEPDDLEANSASPPFGGRSGVTDTRAGGGGGGGGGGMDLFTTSLPLRLDHEACLAYLCLPPAGGVILLILEHKSDYVRTQVPRMAIESGIHGPIHHPPDIFVVEGVVVVAARV